MIREKSLSKNILGQARYKIGLSPSQMINLTFLLHLPNKPKRQIYPFGKSGKFMDLGLTIWNHKLVSSTGWKSLSVALSNTRHLNFFCFVFYFIKTFKP